MRLSRLATAFALALAVSSLSACAEDLGPVTQGFTTVVDGWNKQLGELKTADAALTEKLAAIAPPDATDAAGKDLKAKADAAVGDAHTALGELDKLVTDTRSSFDKATADKKVEPLQHIVDDGKTAFDNGSKKVAGLAATAQGAFDAWKKHADEEAAKAAAAAAAAAAREAEEQKVLHEGGAIDFAVVVTAEGVDATSAGLPSLQKFLGACDGLKVDYTVFAADDKVAKAGVTSVKETLVKAGVAATHLGKGASKAGDAKLTLQVVKPCT